MAQKDPAMIDILAIYDLDHGETVELRELTADEVADNGEALYAAKRQQYPPPRYILKLGVAQDMQSFLTNYPRFRDGAPTETGQSNPTKGDTPP